MSQEDQEADFVQQLLQAQVDALIARVFPQASEQEKTELRNASMARLTSTQDEGEEAFAPVVQAMGVIAKNQGLSLEQAAPLYEEYMDKLLQAIAAQQLGQQFFGGKTPDEIAQYFGDSAGVELNAQGEVTSDPGNEHLEMCLQFLREGVKKIYPQIEAQPLEMLARLCWYVARESEDGGELTEQLTAVLEEYKLDQAGAERHTNIEKINQLLEEFGSFVVKDADERVMKDLSAYEQSLPAEDSATRALIARVRELVAERQAVYAAKNWTRFEEIREEIGQLYTQLYGGSPAERH